MWFSPSPLLMLDTRLASTNDDAWMSKSNFNLDNKIHTICGHHLGGLLLNYDACSTLTGSKSKQTLLRTPSAAIQTDQTYNYITCFLHFTPTRCNLVFVCWCWHQRWSLLWPYWFKIWQYRWSSESDPRKFHCSLDKLNKISWEEWNTLPWRSRRLPSTLSHCRVSLFSMQR